VLTGGNHSMASITLATGGFLPHPDVGLRLVDSAAATRVWASGSWLNLAF
jgi:hypothetical protein